MNCLKHASEILIDVAIPKTKNAEIPSREIGVSCCIARLMVVEVMLAVIDLDDKAMPETK